MARRWAGLRRHRIVRVWIQWRDLYGHPHVQRERGKDFLEIGFSVGAPEADSAPLARLCGRPPQSQEVAHLREFGSADSLAILGGVDRRFRRSMRDVRGEGGEEFHRTDFFFVV